jgi:probable rRNA maturation factor
MTRLNEQYRGKAYATDVLSFPSPEVFQSMGQLGELVVCLPVLKRQARELGHAPEQELDVLLAHGALHLLGLDHELGPKQSAEMARLEARLLPARAKGLIRRTE